MPTRGVHCPKAPVVGASLPGLAGDRRWRVEVAARVGGIDDAIEQGGENPIEDRALIM
jgi:phage gp37-like protein